MKAKSGMLRLCTALKCTEPCLLIGAGVNPLWVRRFPEDVLVENPLYSSFWFLVLYKIKREVKLQSFMYRIFHRVIPCNLYLRQLWVVESNICKFCEEPGTLIHFFYECEQTLLFWNGISNWLFKNEIFEDVPGEIDDIQFLFGAVDNSKDGDIFNYVINLDR